MFRLAALGLSADAASYLVNLAAIVSLLCATGCRAVLALRRNSAPLRHGVLVGTLALALLSPPAVWVAQQNGLALVRMSVSHPLEINGVSTPAANVPATTELPASDLTDRAFGVSSDAAFSDRLDAGEPKSPPQISGIFDKKQPDVAAEANGTQHVAAEANGTRSVPAAWWQTTAAFAALLWMLGAAAGLIRLGFGYAKLARFCRRLERLSEKRHESLVRRAAEMLKRQAPPVFFSHVASVPVSIGLRRPAIVLPAAMAENPDEAQWQAVLLHEMAHIARRDHWVGVGQRLATALFWWNPLVHRVSNAVSELREEICDNHVLLAQGEGRPLAQILVELAACVARQPALPSTIGVLDPRPTGLAGRVHRLLLSDKDRNMETRMNFRSKVFVLACGLIAIVGMASVGGLRLTYAEAPAKTNQEEPKPGNSAVTTVKEKADKKGAAKDAFHFSVVVARHVMLLDGKEIVAWRQIEDKIAKRAGRLPAQPNFYVTHGAYEAGLYEPARNKMLQLQSDGKLAPFGAHIMSLQDSFRYDRIRTPAGLKPDESLRQEGVVVNLEGKPVADAEVILVTLFDKSVRYINEHDCNTYGIQIEQGRVLYPLDHVITRSNAVGRFAVYPPKGEVFRIIAMHPDAGVGIADKTSDRLALAPWAGVVCNINKGRENQEALLRTVVSQPDNLPELIFDQSMGVPMKLESDQKSKATLSFRCTRVPPGPKTTILRHIATGTFVEAAVELLPGETKQIGLGPVTKQQHELIGQIQLPETAMSATNRNTSKNAPHVKATDVSKAANSITYRGKVVDKVTGRPVEGATVLVRRSILSPTERRVLEETKHATDAEGNYSFFLPPEQVAMRYLYLEFEVEHSRYAHRSPEGYALSMIRKNEKLGMRPFFERLQVRQGEEISGTLATPDGRPAAGVLVMVYSKAKKDDMSDYGSFARTKTDAKGAFRINVVKGGETVLWLLPDQHAPSTHLYHQPHGDLGRFPLEKGETLQGRVVSLDGKPFNKVWVSAELSGGPAKKQIEMPVSDMLGRSVLTDAEGKFTMAPLPAGKYTLIIEEYPRTGGVMDRTRYPVPDVFLQQKVAIEASKSPQPVEIRAVPHVCINIRQVDGKGKPKKTHAVHFDGRIGDRWFWTEGRPDADGKIVIKIPKGIDDPKVQIMTNEHGAARWRYDEGKSGKSDKLCNTREIKMWNLVGDRSLVIYYYNAPIVLVKALAEDGAAIQDVRPQIIYPNLKKPHETTPCWIDERLQGDVQFEKQEDGRWRTESLLPDESFLLIVEAKGFQPSSQRLSLAEGEVKELVARLKKE
jgi:beta-lactamase regulating signal transducer with metallopeptidase domain